MLMDEKKRKDIDDVMGHARIMILREYVEVFRVEPRSRIDLASRIYSQHPTERPETIRGRR